MDKYKTGVSNDLSYSVDIEKVITDVKLWRIIINGYPYKTIQELGCSSKEEAFTATKQAIYCYIHGNNPNDYAPIGEAGVRTLNALKTIVNNGNNSTEMQISNNVTINKENVQFNVDSIDKNYVSKTYSIKAGASISNYKISATGKEQALNEVIRITDVNNKDKKEFSPDEKFKILIPIKNLTSRGSFTLKVETKINNKPVLYGKPENSSFQDYALTAATYDDAKGETEDFYYKNETRLKIIKQDEDTKERLENVVFNILDSEKKPVYANLKTDSNGEIEIINLIPGKYYIQEASTKDGYILSEDLIEFNINFNQRLTITINNLFEKIPEIEVEDTDTSEIIVNNSKENELPEKVELKEIKKTIQKKLPVTGM